MASHLEIALKVWHNILNHELNTLTNIHLLDSPHYNLIDKFWQDYKNALINATLFEAQFNNNKQDITAVENSFAELINNFKEKILLIQNELSTTINMHKNNEIFLAPLMSELIDKLDFTAKIKDFFQKKPSNFFDLKNPTKLKNDLGITILPEIDFTKQEDYSAIQALIDHLQKISEDLRNYTKSQEYKNRNESIKYIDIFTIVQQTKSILQELVKEFDLDDIDSICSILDSLKDKQFHQYINYLVINYPIAKSFPAINSIVQLIYTSRPILLKAVNNYFNVLLVFYKLAELTSELQTKQKLPSYIIENKELIMDIIQHYTNVSSTALPPVNLVEKCKFFLEKYTFDDMEAIDEQEDSAPYAEKIYNMMLILTWQTEIAQANAQFAKLALELSLSPIATKSELNCDIPGNDGIEFEEIYRDAVVYTQAEMQEEKEAELAIDNFLENSEPITTTKESTMELSQERDKVTLNAMQRFRTFEKFLQNTTDDMEVDEPLSNQVPKRLKQEYDNSITNSNNNSIYPFQKTTLAPIKDLTTIHEVVNKVPQAKL